MLTLTYLIFWGILLSLHTCTGQVSRFQLEDDDLDTGIPGRLPPGISPPGESPSGQCCAGLPVATPMPESPFPICPGGLPPLFNPDGGPDGGGTALACLPTSQTCPPNSACWYNGIDYYCCPMESAPGYGPPRPIYGYGGGVQPPGDLPGRLPIGVHPPSDSGEDSAGQPPGDLPGRLPIGVHPPSDSGEDRAEVSPPGSVPRGVHPPSASGEISPPGSVPKGIRPPSSSEVVNAPGRLPHGIRPPGGHNGGRQYPWKKKTKPTGLQPPPFGAGTFPNPFTCCNGDNFHSPAHLPRNINAPSERTIGYIQFFGGHNIWPPKDTGKAKFGGPIKPDFLWFPGHHSHLSNELGCCGGDGGGGYGGGTPNPPSGYGRPQPEISPPADK